MIYNKINIPTEVSTEHDVNDVLDNIIAIWEACEKIKKYFPSVWHAISDQYNLDTIFDKTISVDLFISKIKVLLL